MRVRPKLRLGATNKGVIIFIVRFTDQEYETNWRSAGPCMIAQPYKGPTIKTCQLSKVQRASCCFQQRKCCLCCLGQFIEQLHIDRIETIDKLKGGSIIIMHTHDIAALNCCTFLQHKLHATKWTDCMWYTNFLKVNSLLWTLSSNFNLNCICNDSESCIFGMLNIFNFQHKCNIFRGVFWCWRCRS
jgi:hypothetical protein